MAKPLRFQAVLATSVALYSLASAADSYNYTAVLKAPTRVAGQVVASSITWKCEATTCTTVGPWPKPGVSACATLAQQVGQVIAYGHPGAQLSPADLAICNKSVAANIAPQTIKPPVIQPGAPQNPGQQQPAQSGGQQTPPSQPPSQSPEQGSKPASGKSEGFSPRTVRTPTLTVTGTGALAPTGPFTPMSVRTPPLTVTGTGASAPTGSFSPKSIRTPSLTATGTGSL